MKNILIVLAALAILAAGAYPLLARSQGMGRGFFSGQGQYIKAPAPDADNDPRGFGRSMGRFQRGFRGQRGNDTWQRGYGNTGRGGYWCPYRGRW